MLKSPPRARHKDCLSAHEPGHGKNTSMSLQSGVGGREYRKRELDFPWAFTPDKTRTRDKSTTLELLRKFPRFFALRVALKELLWFRIEFARFPIAGKATKGNYVCVEILTLKPKYEILISVQSYHTPSSDRWQKCILPCSECNHNDKTRGFIHFLLNRPGLKGHAPGAKSKMS